MRKHTPGPWSLSEETHRDGLRSKLIHGMPEGMLAIVRVEHQGAYYGDANARLIAAAPDMLDALQHLSSVYEHIWVKMSDGEMAIVKGAWEVAEAAIAKAEGRS